MLDSRVIHDQGFGSLGVMIKGLELFLNSLHLLCFGCDGWYLDVCPTHAPVQLPMFLFLSPRLN